MAQPVPNPNYNDFIKYIDPITYRELEFANIYTMNSIGLIQKQSPDMSDKYRSVSGNLPSKSDTNYFNAEFEVLRIEGAVTHFLREEYTGLDYHCCLFKTPYYYSNLKTSTDMDETEIISRYQSSGSEYIRSCEPGMTDITGSLCDGAYYDYCVLNIKQLPTTLSDFDFDLIPICETWFRTLYLRDGGTLHFDPRNDMIDACSGNLNNNPYCKDWILGIRETDDPELNDIADQVLFSQHDIDQYPCLHLPKYITKQANQYSTSFECWYAPCTEEPRYKLSFQNLKNRNQCHISNCNITIGSINVGDKTKIDILCNNFETLTKEEQLNNKKYEENNTLFPLLKWTFLVSIIILFIIYLGFSFLDLIEPKIKDRKDTRIIKFK